MNLGFCLGIYVRVLQVQKGFHESSIGALLEGSWVVINGVRSPLMWFMTIVTLLITPLVATREPPSSLERLEAEGFRGRGPRHTFKRDVMRFSCGSCYITLSVFLSPHTRPENKSTIHCLQCMNPPVLDACLEMGHQDID